MTINLRLYALLLLMVVYASCTGQSKKEPLPKEAEVVQKPTKVDPYFTQTEEESSLYGPQSITRNILQDRQGNIWLATWEGILRYDGQNFVNFTIKDNLERFHVFSLLEDRKGNLWFGTIGAGVYRYDGNSFTHFTTNEGLVHDGIGCFYEDKAGNIWIGTQKGISVYDGTEFRSFTKEDGMPDDDVNSIIEDENGKFWIGTRGEACFYDGKSFTKITNDLGSAFVNTRSIIQDSHGNIWLGGNGGLWRYDGSKFDNLSTAFVGYIYEDSKANIWTSSQSPVSREEWLLSRYSSIVLPFQTNKPTLIHKEKGMLFGLFEDQKGGIWFGSLVGAGRYDGRGIERFSDSLLRP